MLSLGLIGYPLQQSLSPLLQNAALQAMGLKGKYELYPIPALPEGAPLLIQRIQQIRQGELNGLNVTIPHKQSVIPYLDRLSEQAEAIGAVNTIFCREGRVIGHNTDAAGFIMDLNRVLLLDRETARLTQDGAERDALVLGAGGAARAVVFALRKEGWKVTLAARSKSQAEGLVSSFDRLSITAPTDLSTVALEKFALKGLIPGLIVNASSAGMFPNLDTSAWPDGLLLPRDAFVYDLVYKPPITKLMRTSRQAGLAVSNGLGMLVEQAALALEEWTGTEAPRQVMWEAISHITTDPLARSGQSLIDEEMR